MNLAIETTMRQYHSLYEWFKTPLGDTVAKECALVLASCGQRFIGEHLLQLGSCGDNPWLSSMHYTYQWMASPFMLSEHDQVLQCHYSQLPFDRNSMDCIIAPLVLEPFRNSLNLLDEIDRVLKSMGYLILFSFNPFSLWGAALKFKFLDCYHGSNIKLRTPYTIKRTLLQRGYQHLLLTHFCYIPPVHQPSTIHKFRFLNEVGKMLWPIPSGLYCYILQKQTLIAPTPVWFKTRPALEIVSPGRLAPL